MGTERTVFPATPPFDSFTLILAHPLCAHSFLLTHCVMQTVAHLNTITHPSVVQLSICSLRLGVS